jgi:large subunit ribosomal protein L13
MTQEITRQRHEVDAAGRAPGRVATEVAMMLRGKNKPSFAPHIDAGDFVTVINAGQVLFTGDKLVQKDYHHHTMHPGGIKTKPLKHVFENDPGEVIRKAVYGMLPKNSQRDEMMKRLTVTA